MENTITIAVSDTNEELREHGTAAFPFAAYHTTEKSPDIPWHWHEEYEFSVVTKGQVSYCVGSETFVLREGDGLFVNSGTLHTQMRTQASQTFLKQDLVFHGRLVYGSMDSIFWQKYIRPVTANSSLAFFHLHASAAWQKAILDLITEAIHVYQTARTGYEFEIRRILSRIFLLLYENKKELVSEKQKEKPQEMMHVKAMLQYMHQHYSETISLKDLAASANICEREALRSFRNMIRQSPIQYLIRYRIGKACQLLDSTDKNVTEICNQCGFSSSSYFSETFKKIVGCQPREYRKRK